MIIIETERAVLEVDICYCGGEPRIKAANDLSYFVYCPRCGRTGKDDMTLVYSIKNWNETDWNKRHQQIDMDFEEVHFHLK